MEVVDSSLIIYSQIYIKLRHPFLDFFKKLSRKPVDRGSEPSPLNLPNEPMPCLNN
jgi:hypothetical protein